MGIQANLLPLQVWPTVSEKVSALSDQKLRGVELGVLFLVEPWN